MSCGCSPEMCSCCRVCAVRSTTAKAATSAVAQTGSGRQRQCPGCCSTSVSPLCPHQTVTVCCTARHVCTASRTRLLLSAAPLGMFAQPLQPDCCCLLHSSACLHSLSNQTVAVCCTAHHVCTASRTRLLLSAAQLGMSTQNADSLRIRQLLSAALLGVSTQTATRVEAGHSCWKVSMQ